MNNNWFEVKVKYTKMIDDGTFKRVSESFLVAAMTFGDAEERIYEELGNLIRGEFIVTAIKKENIHDIFGYDDSEVWYKSTISFESTGDGEGGKGKKVKQVLLLTASSVKQATERVIENLAGLMVDFKVVGTVESQIMDVFPFNSSDAVNDVTFSASYAEEDEVAG